MSFLIEDILSSKNSNEKDEHVKTVLENRLENISVENFPRENRTENFSIDKRPVNLSFNEQNSILHQTLVNRVNSPYYRDNESHQGSNQATPLDGFQYFCYDPAYMNYYRACYERDYSATFQRQKHWPPYDTTQANYMPYSMQYKYIYSPSKRKGGQVRFTANQTDILEKRFCSNKYLSPEERKDLAASLSLSDRQVKTWFQNRRAKWRRSNSIDTPQEHLTDERSNKTNSMI